MFVRLSQSAISATSKAAMSLLLAVAAACGSASPPTQKAEDPTKPNLPSSQGIPPSIGAGTGIDTSKQTNTMSKDEGPTFLITGPTIKQDSLTPTITWAALPGAKTYDIAIDDEASCASPSIVMDAGIIETSYTPVIPLQDGKTYYVCVAAHRSASLPRFAENNGFALMIDMLPPPPPTNVVLLPGAAANNNSPIIKGDSVPGTDVKVFTNATCSGASYAAGPAAMFQNPGIAAPVADDTATAFYVAAVDIRNKISTCSLAPLVYTEDSTPPSVPVSLVIAPVGPANNNAPIITGTADALSTVEVFTNAACTGAPAASGAAGQFSAPGITLSVVDDTSTTFYVRAVDAVGNASGCSTTGLVYVEDSTPPALPAPISVAPAGPANNNNPSVTVIAEAGSTVKVYMNASCTAPVAQTGSAAAFAAGVTIAVADDTTTSFYATATDASGNTSNCSSAFATYVEDSTPPAAPSVLSMSPVGPANNNAPSVKGTAEAGSSINVYTDNTCSGVVTASGSAAALAGAGITVAVGNDSTTNFYLKATDTAGNVSACSAAIAYIEDSTPPAAPVVTAASPVGPSSNSTPSITGTSEAGSTVKLYSNNTCTSGILASGTDAAFVAGLSVTVSLNVTTTIYATSTDVAGNTSTCSSTFATYTHDSTPPAAPAALALSPAGPSNVNTTSLSGTAEAGSTVKIYSNNTCTSSVAQSGTAASFATGLALAVSDDTTTSFYATATDAAGNVSLCSTSTASYVEDSTAPAVPSGLAMSPVGPANNNTPKVIGTAEAGSTVEVYTNVGCTGGVAATGAAAAFLSPGLPVTVTDNTTTNFYVHTTDSAGNVSPCSSTPVAFVEDSTPPALPTVSSSSPASPSSNITPFIIGTAEAGSTVKLYTNNTCTSAVLATGTAAAFTSSGIPVTVTADSTTSIYATATDAANNVSGCATTFLTFVHDSTPPARPTGLATSPAGPSSSLTTSLSGTAEAGSTVKVYTNNTCTSAILATGSASAFATGLTVTPSANATTTMYATATDASGNVSACSTSSASYVQDSIGPAAPTGIVVAPVGPANNNSPVLTGSAEAGSSVNVYTSAGCSGGSVASGSAAAFASPGLTLSVLDNTTSSFYVRATDVANNVGTCSSAVSYTEDSTPPAAASGITMSPVGPANNNSPVVKGTAEALSTVEVYLNAACTGGTAATGTAAQFAGAGITVAVSDDSNNSIYIRLVDQAGNSSSCSSAVTYVEDSTGPSAPTVSAAAPVGPANNNSPAITGSGEAGSTIKLYTNSSCTSAVLASGSQATFASTGISASVSDNSTTTIYATATDASGNVSACSSSFVTYNEDSAAPATPSSIVMSPVGPANNNSPKIVGTAEAGSTVDVFTNSGCSGGAAASGTATAFASPGIALTVADNSINSFYVRAVDPAGNISGCSALVSYTEDSLGNPSVPVVTAPVGATATTNASSIHVAGSCTAGMTVRISGDVGTGDVTSPAGQLSQACSGGTFAWDISKSADLVYHFSLLQENPVTLAQSSTVTVTWTRDTVAPSNPVVTAPSPTTLTNAASSLSISGTCTNGETINLTGATTGTMTCASSAFSFSSSKGVDGTYNYTVAAADAAGNSSSGVSVSWTRDTSVPSTPVIMTPATASSYTNNTSIIVAGSCTNGYTVQIAGSVFPSDITNPAGSTTYTCSGASFSFTVLKTIDASYTFSISQQNPVTLTWSASASATVILDTTIPNNPTVTTPATNPLTSGGSSITIAGGCENGATVDLTGDSTQSMVCASNAYNFTVSVSSNGTYYYNVVQTDLALNTSSPGTDVTWNRDNTVPSVPTVTTPSTTPKYTKLSSFTVAGGCTTGYVVHLTGAATSSVTCSASAYSFTINKSTDGQYDLTLFQTNPGNGFSSSNVVVTWMRDTAAPSAPTLTYPASNPYTSGDTTYTLTGACEAQSTVAMTGASSGSVACSGGAFSFPINQSVDGQYDFSLVQTDLAGNVSAALAFQWVRDTQIPTTPVLSSPATATSYTNSSTIVVAGSCTGSNVVTIGGDVIAGEVTSPAGSLTTTCASSSFSFTLSKGADFTYNFDVYQSNAIPVDSATVSATVIVDTGVPTAPVISSPASSPYLSAASITISGTCETDAVVTMTGDIVDTTTCAAGTYSFFEDPGVDGTYNLTLKQTDQAGNMSSGATQVFTRNSTIPGTPTVSSPSATPYVGPSRVLNLAGGCEAGNTVTISGVTITEAGGSLSTTCSGVGTYGYTITLATDKTVTISITQFNGVATSGAKTQQWTADTVAPIASWGGGNPSGTTFSKTAVFTYSQNDGTATLQCNLDGAAFAGCPSPYTLSNLSNASHTFQVRSVDPAGNISTVLSQTWTVLAYDAIALYHFDSGNVYTDSSLYAGAGYANTLTDVGGTTNSSTAPAKFAQYQTLTTAKYLSATHNAAQNAGVKTMTVEMFVKFTTLPTTTGVALAAKSAASPNLGWSLRILKSGGVYKLRLTASRNGTSSSTTTANTSCGVLATATWYHVAMQYNNGAVSFYCNGIYSTATALPSFTTIFSSTAALQIGKDTTTNYLLGSVDEFRLSQRLRYSNANISPLPSAAFTAD